MGQATQLVVGAAEESGRGYPRQGGPTLRRVEPEACLLRPLPSRPTHAPGGAPRHSSHAKPSSLPDWTGCGRIYGFPKDELTPAFDPGGFLPLEFDPKTTIALENVDAFPVDINAATRDKTAPSAGHRTHVGQPDPFRTGPSHSIDTWRDLQAMGVVKSWAWPFLVFPGHRPPRSKQLRLGFSEKRDKIKNVHRRTAPATASPYAAADSRPLRPPHAPAPPAPPTPAKVRLDGGRRKFEVQGRRQHGYGRIPMWRMMASRMSSWTSSGRRRGYIRVGQAGMRNNR